VACAQSFAPWQQATIESMLAISLTIACSRYVYNSVILHAHPVRGESHNQRNAAGEVATQSTPACGLTHGCVTMFSGSQVYKLYSAPAHAFRAAMKLIV